MATEKEKVEARLAKLKEEQAKLTAKRRELDAAEKARVKAAAPPPRRKLLTLRLEDSVVEHYRKIGGKGWLQTVNDTLKRAMNG